MNIRAVKTKVLIQELVRRRSSLLAERDFVAKRLSKLDEELSHIQAQPEVGKATVAPVAKRRIVTRRNEAYVKLQEILRNSTKPLSAPAAEVLLRKSVSVLSNEYTSKALSRLYDKGLLTRSGTRNRYLYSWKATPKTKKER